MVGSCLLVLAATTRTPPLTPTTPVTAVLTRHGVRGAALARLGRRVPEDTEEAAEALELALGELAAAGVGAKTVARMLTRQPRALPPLLSRCPGPLLAAMAEAGLPPAAELLAAEPLLLSLDPARLQNALSFLAPFVSGSETNQSVSAFVARQPQALLWRSERESPIVVALEEMGLPRRAVRKATTGFKPVHTLASADNARQALCYLRDALHLDLAGLGALVHTFPNILGVSQAKVQPTFDFLVGISDQATAARAVRRCPQLLGLSLASNLRPTVAYLSSLGVDLGRVLRTFGTALALSLDGKLRPTVLFLESEAGIGAIGRVLSSQPALLSLSIEANLRPKCAYLRELGMTDLGRLVSQYPPVLSLSLEDNLKPTAQALIQAGVLHPPDPNIRPRHLAASLDRRRNITPSIGAVTTSSDADFCKQVGCSRGEWDAYQIKVAGCAPTGAANTAGGLSIPWLPEGIDLAAMLFADAPADDVTPQSQWAKPPKPEPEKPVKQRGRRLRSRRKQAALGRLGGDVEARGVRRVSGVGISRVVSKPRRRRSASAPAEEFGFGVEFAFDDE